MRTTHFITVNAYSRPGRRLDSVNGIVWHWVGNPGATPEQNRDYFESLKDGRAGTFASAHYIVGVGGDVVQCIPETEVAYHAGSLTYKPEAVDKFGPYPNATTIGIEVCHEDWTGRFTEAAVSALVALSADICRRHDLRPCTDIVRHFDITGKDCPRWYVNNPDEFRATVARV